MTITGFVAQVRASDYGYRFWVVGITPEGSRYIVGATKTRTGAERIIERFTGNYPTPASRARAASHYAIIDRG